MEFKKIDDTKFQCLLFEEDMEDNNISLDDFFKNDTDKIHSLLDVVMEEAKENIGIEMDGGVMSLQLAPQPDHSLLLTISSGKDDFTDMLRQAGERAAQAINKLNPERKDKSNVIKNGGDNLKAASFTPFDKVKEAIDKTKEDNADISVDESNTGKIPEEINRDNVYSIFRFDTFDDFEDFCKNSIKTWGLTNALYKDNVNGRYYLVVKKGRCSDEKYKIIVRILMEYSNLDSVGGDRYSWVVEHCDVIIHNNAVNSVKKYL